jgi:hypothetical protein
LPKIQLQALQAVVWMRMLAGIGEMIWFMIWPLRVTFFMTILLACLRRYFFNDNLLKTKSQKFCREICFREKVDNGDSFLQAENSFRALLPEPWLHHA